MKVLKNVLFALVFLLVILILVFVMMKKDGEVANIYCDGKLIQSINLGEVKESVIIEVGEHNTVLAEKGQIRMLKADCPDKLCVKQGVICDSGYPIVCLPNKVIIRIEE